MMVKANAAIPLTVSPVEGNPHKEKWVGFHCFPFFSVTCHPGISRSTTKTRFLQKLITSSVPLRSSLTSVLHLTTILVLVTATLASVPLAQAVKNEGHAAGGMAITAAAAANAGMATNIFFFNWPQYWS